MDTPLTGSRLNGPHSMHSRLRYLPNLQLCKKKMQGKNNFLLKRKVREKINFGVGKIKNTQSEA